jgi:two-component system sensor histidine kinase KdpD
MNLHALTRDYRVGIAAALAGTAIATGAMTPFHDSIGLLNAGLVLLLITLIVSATWGWRVGLFAAMVANLGLNFFFVEPLFTFTVYETRNVFALLVFLVVSLVGGRMLSLARDAARTAQQRQAETEVLLGLSRELIGRAEPVEALNALCQSAVRAFEAPGASVLSPSKEGWSVLAYAGDMRARRDPDGSERLMAQQGMETGVLTWLGHTGLTKKRRTRRAAIPGPGRRVEDINEGVAFMPLKVGDRTLGVLRLDGPIGDTPFRDHPEQLLEGFAREAALGVQRVELTHEAAHAEALRYADEMKTALLTSISHDLKTPLAGIKAAVSSLLDASIAWSDEDKASFLETIDSQADRLDHVISDILDLNRIESGVVRPVQHSVNARDLLEEAVERTRAATLGRMLSIEADTSRVYTDESLIVQALVNLIENAAKYSTPGGAIRLTAVPAASGVELRVEDDGPGIAESDLPHIFDRFYRAADSSGRVKGSGLGLAIVKGFVQLSGGTVQATTSPAGTCFTIKLPSAVQVGAA